MRDLMLFIAMVISVPIAFAMTRALVHAVGTALSGNAPHLEHARVVDPVAVVTLIHGTFARGAPWTMPGSALSDALECQFGGRVQLRRFDWSGHNSFSARRKAVADLARDIERAREGHPGRPHYLVGHSHGGSVALGAAMADSPSPVDGVVCLATPVLTTRRRRFSAWTRRMIGMGLFVSLGLPVILPLLAQDRDATDNESAYILFAAVLAFLWYRTGRKLAREVCEKRPYYRLERDRVAFIRSPFDEASGIIALVNFVSWMVNRAVGGPARLFASFSQPVGLRARALALLGYAGVFGVGFLLDIAPEQSARLEALLDAILPFWLGYYLVAGFTVMVGSIGFILGLLAPLLHKVRSNWVFHVLLSPIYTLFLFLAAFLFVPAILLTGLLQALAVGWEMLLCAIFVEVTAEPCPAGQWTVRQLRAPPEGTLRHSSVYESVAGLAALEDVFTQFGSSLAPNCPLM